MLAISEVSSKENNNVKLGRPTKTNRKNLILYLHRSIPCLASTSLIPALNDEQEDNTVPSIHYCMQLARAKEDSFYIICRHKPWEQSNLLAILCTCIFSSTLIHGIARYNHILCRPWWAVRSQTTLLAFYCRSSCSYPHGIARYCDIIHHKSCAHIWWELPR